MKQIIIHRLFHSFVELEQAIQTARQTLRSQKKQPRLILERLGTYEEILEKQRSLANDLCDHVTAKNWPEVCRHVRLINGLSAMIRDDARDILANLKTPCHAVEEKQLMLT